jgi:type 1 glutamine amidotransferase
MTSRLRFGTIAALVTAAAAVPRSALVQSADTLAPVLAAATLSPLGPVQYGTGTAGTQTVRGTGVGTWNTNKDGITITFSATDNVGVTKFQYALVTASAPEGRGGGGGGRGPGGPGGPGGGGPGGPGAAPGGGRARGGDPNAPPDAGNPNAAGRAAGGGGRPGGPGGPVADTGPVGPCWGTPGATGNRGQGGPGSPGGGPGGPVAAPAAPDASTFKDLSPTAPGPSATATLKITQEGNNTVWYRAVDAAGNISPLRSVQVPIDTVAPAVTFPDVVNNTIGHSAVIVPTRTDPAPGSGGVAIRETEIDGKFAYPDALDASTLSLGKHSWTLTAADVAGNGSKTTFTFVVVTSFADVDALIDRNAKDNTIPVGAAAALKAQLATAKAAADGKDAAATMTALTQFANEVRTDVPAGTVRTLFTTDAEDLQRQARGTAAPGVAGLGVTSAPAKGANQHLFVSPLMSSSKAGGNASARFKVLVISNCADGFRHESIQTTERVIGQLGKDNNFDVDVYDYVFPDVSVSNPFTSLDNLKKYKVIVGVSSVGNNTFAKARLQPDGSVVDEQKILQDFIHQGGGFVGTHGASDSMHNWEWYKQMFGAEFAGHGGNAQGMQPQCPSCNVSEVVTEDPSHPSTQQFDKTWPVRDELYNFRNAPRERVHVLLTLTDATFATAIGGSTGPNQANAVPGYGPDHPISWCQNFEGGRTFAQVLTHNWELSLDPRIQRNLLKGIEWAAGAIPGNCVTHREVKSQIADAQASGTLNAAAATKATSLVESAYGKYLQKNYTAAITDIDALRTLANTASSGAAPARAALAAKAQELKDWMTVLARH